MAARFLSFVFCIVVGCGTEGGPGGGDRHLPNAGFGPYAWLEDGDTPKSLFPNQNRLEAPFALSSADTVDLFFSSCPMNDTCRIVRARSQDGLLFTEPQIVATHQDGLREPYVVRAGTGLILWTLSADRSKVFRFDSSGSQFEFSETILAAEPDTSFSALSVLSSGMDTEVFLRINSDDSKWIRRQVNASGSVNDILLCGSNCWSTTPPHDYELKSIRTALGRTLFRGLGTATNDADESTLGFIGSDDGKHWDPFQFNPVLTSDTSIESATFAQLPGRYFIYARTGRRIPKIIMAVSRRGQPSILPSP